MRTAFQFFVVPLLILILILGVLIPRLAPQPAFPDTREALEVKARAERLYADMTQSDSFVRWVRNNLLVQQVTYHNYRELPGSCSGFADQPKVDQADDRYVDMMETGLFGIQLRSWHAVCGGRIPLKRSVIVAPTKAGWEASFRSQQLEHCKTHNLSCGNLGDFRILPGNPNQ